MEYDLGVKLKAREMYKEGTPRRVISDTMGIPLRTIESWTQDIVSAPLVFIRCAECGKKHRTLNIQKTYCSAKCKNRANYLRRRDRLPGPTTRFCQHCGKQYQPAHGNAKKYCTPECRKNAACSRRLKQGNQLQAQASKEQFNQCLELLWKARIDAMDLNIHRAVYRTELDIITEYYAVHKSLLTEREYYRVQEVFNSVK